MPFVLLKEQPQTDWLLNEMFGVLLNTPILIYSITTTNTHRYEFCKNETTAVQNAITLYINLFKKPISLCLAVLV